MDRGCFRDRVLVLAQTALQPGSLTDQSWELPLRLLRLAAKRALVRAMQECLGLYNVVCHDGRVRATRPNEPSDAIQQ